MSSGEMLGHVFLASRKTPVYDTPSDLPLLLLLLLLLRSRGAHHRAARFGVNPAVSSHVEGTHGYTSTVGLQLLL